MIHSFVTDGYIQFAEIFLHSLQHLYGNKIYVRIDSCDLSKKNRNKLKDIHNNLDIFHTELDINYLTSELNIKQHTLYFWKKEIEANRTTSKNFWYKIYISVDKRYRMLDEIIQYAKDQNYSYLLHLDIDNYLRTQFIENLISVVKDYDIGIFINNSEEHTKKYWGGFICFNLTGNIDDFIYNWMHEIDKYDLKNRWKDFGQSALNFAIDKTENLKVAN